MGHRKSIWPTKKYAPNTSKKFSIQTSGQRKTRGAAGHWSTLDQQENVCQNGMECM